MSADKTPTIRLHADDNVVVARADILPGVEIPGENIRAAVFIPNGHKIATAPVAAGEAWVPESAWEPCLLDFHRRTEGRPVAAASPPGRK